MDDFTWFIILMLIFLLADDEPMPSTEEEMRSFFKRHLEELQIDDCNSLEKLHD